MLIEAIIAFALVLLSTLVIYALGKKSASKPNITVNQQDSYACGEKTSYTDLKINISLYKYLIYFVIFDASILVLAFASFSTAQTNPVFIFLYLSIILVAGIALLEREKD